MRKALSVSVLFSGIVIGLIISLPLTALIPRVFGVQAESFSTPSSTHSERAPSEQAAVVMNKGEREALFKQLAELIPANPASTIVPKLVTPSTVNIAVDRHRSARNPGGEPAKGSGFVLRANGFIATNYHVVENGRRIRVTTYDGQEFSATLVGVDRKTDLAVVKIDAVNLLPVRLGDSDALQVGETVMAIGNAFGSLGHTVTQGVVSAVGRSNVEVIASRYRYENFIQTDAAINKGNSGGPLITMRGEVVGINTAILSGSGGFEGVGLATPINEASFVFDRLIEHGKVVRGWLGIQADPITVEQVRAVTGEPNLEKGLATLGLDAMAGVYVSKIERDTPASRSKPLLRTGDIIVEYNGWSVTDLDTFRSRVARTAVNEVVTMTVLRASRKLLIRVKIGEQPSD